MKRSFYKLGLLIVFALLSNVPSVRAISMPRFSMPSISSFNLSALKTPEAVSNALSKLSSAFSLLSRKTLASIVKTQTKRLEENIDAFIKDPSSVVKGGSAAANAIAAAAAILALAAYTMGKKGPLIKGTPAVPEIEWIEPIQSK